MRKHQAYERMRELGYYDPSRYLQKIEKKQDFQSQEARSQSVNNYNRNNQFNNGSKRPYMNNSPTIIQIISLIIVKIIKISLVIIKISLIIEINSITIVGDRIIII